MHVPVMVGQVVELLQIRPGGIYLDGTLGAGGHARACLERMQGRGMLVGIDQDRQALALAQAALAPWQGQCRLIYGNFAEMTDLAAGAGVGGVDGILLDLGVSSMQLDTPQRGFAFRTDGPLDMRMDLEAPLTAADLLARADQEKLTGWLRNYGEEPAAGRVARAIIRARDAGRLNTTADLARTVAAAKGRVRGRLHPATRVFQALRMAVNDELTQLDRGLEAGLRLLRPGGRMAVLAYHSLEDRQVKMMIRRHTPRKESLAGGGYRQVGAWPPVRPLNRRPLRPDEDEVRTNKRARSALLRVMQRTE